MSKKKKSCTILRVRLGWSHLKQTPQEATVPITQLFEDTLPAWLTPGDQKWIMDLGIISQSWVDGGEEGRRNGQWLISSKLFSRGFHLKLFNLPVERALRAQVLFTIFTIARLRAEGRSRTLWLLLLREREERRRFSSIIIHRDWQSASDYKRCRCSKSEAIWLKDLGNHFSATLCSGNGNVTSYQCVFYIQVFISLNATTSDDAGISTTKNRDVFHMCEAGVIDSNCVSGSKTQSICFPSKNWESFKMSLFLSQHKNADETAGATLFSFPNVETHSIPHFSQNCIFLVWTAIILNRSMHYSQTAQTKMDI